jgi:hypothetical protein
MSTSIVFTIGTPLGQWARWATELLGQTPAGKRLCLPAFVAWHTALLGADGMGPAALSDAQRAALDSLPPNDADAGPWGGVDARACWTLDALMKRFPEAQYLVFIESAAVGLAAALAAGQTEDPADWLAAWRAGAQLVLRLAQRAPTSCLLVDAGEAQRDPKAFASAFSSRFGADLAAQEAELSAAAIDPLSWALGQALAFADRDIQAQFAELQATCILLSPEESTPLSAGQGLQIDGAAAARRLKALHAVQQEAASRTSDQVAALRERVESQALTLKQQADQFAATVTERDAQTRLAETATPAERPRAADLQSRLNEANQALNAGQEERELLSLQLLQLQEELESVCQAGREADERLARARVDATHSAAQIASLREGMTVAEAARDSQARAAGELQQQLAEMSKVCEQHESQLRDVQARLASMEADRMRLAQQRDDAILVGKQRSAELETVVADRAAQVVQLTQERDKHAKLSGERQAQLMALSQARAEIERAAQARQTQIEVLTQAKSAAEKCVVDRDAQIEQLKNLRDEQARLADDRHLQLQVLEQAMADLENTSQKRQAQIEVLTQDKFAAEKSAADHAAQVQQLAQARDKQAELDGRQRSAELDAARRDRESARVEHELLALQLQQVQEELELHCLECRRLEGSVTALMPAAGWLGLFIAEMLPSAERNAPPHRELTFTLRQVKVGTRDIPEAMVRLVEHHGHPGLVVFSGIEGPQLLESWRESGREDDRAYALLIPSDAHSKPFFDAMGSADWLLMQAVAVRMEMHLHQASPPLAPRWRQVARRLREELMEMPPRFRYGTLDVEPMPDAATVTLAFRFGQVLCGARQLERLTVHWRLTGPQAGLDLLCDPVAGPPLPSWPDDERGASPDRLVMPLASNLSEQDRRDFLVRLAPADQDFVLAVLAAWAGVAARVPPELLGADYDAPASVLAATALLRDAHSGLASGSARGTHPGSLLRRVVRRMRQVSAPAQ